MTLTNKNVPFIGALRDIQKNLDQLANEALRLDLEEISFLIRVAALAAGDAALESTTRNKSNTHFSKREF